MASEIRVNQIQNRTGVSTISFTESGLIFAGISTFQGPVTVDGNLTVDGVVTYDDVTNIDSVGIITARNGLHVVGTGSSVGIGTDNPRSKLDIQGTDAELRIYRDDGTRFGGLRYTGSIFKLRLPTNDPFTIDDASDNERLRITSAGKVGISSIIPKTDVDISQKTGAVALPQGTTAQRPSGSAPYIRKNTTNNALEFYNGTNWVEIITDYFPTGSTILG